MSIEQAKTLDTSISEEMKLNLFEETRKNLLLLKNTVEDDKKNTEKIDVRLIHDPDFISRSTISSVILEKSTIDGKFDRNVAKKIIDRINPTLNDICIGPDFIDYKRAILDTFQNKKICEHFLFNPQEFQDRIRGVINTNRESKKKNNSAVIGRESTLFTMMGQYDSDAMAELFIDNYDKMIETFEEIRGNKTDFGKSFFLGAFNVNNNMDNLKGVADIFKEYCLGKISFNAFAVRCWSKNNNRALEGHSGVLENATQTFATLITSNASSNEVIKILGLERLFKSFFTSLDAGGYDGIKNLEDVFASYNIPKENKLFFFGYIVNAMETTENKGKTIDEFLKSINVLEDQYGYIKQGIQEYKNYQEGLRSPINPDEEKREKFLDEDIFGIDYGGLSTYQNFFWRLNEGGYSGIKDLETLFTTTYKLKEYEKMLFFGAFVKVIDTFEYRDRKIDDILAEVGVPTEQYDYMKQGIEKYKESKEYKQTQKNKRK